MAVGRFALMEKLRVCAAAGALTLVVGCNNPSPSDQQIQQKAAQATEQVKQGAQQAASQTRAAAATAEDKINAVAAGVKQGLQSGAAATTINLNTARGGQLETLPGITPAKARRIIAGRPYSAPGDLVSRSLLSQDQFDQISAKVTAP